MEQAINLDAAFSALYPDPTRRAILGRLALGEATVMELADPFDMSQPAVSQHLKVLENAGLIARRVEGASARAAWQKTALKRLTSGSRCYARALAKNYDRLDEVLADMENPTNR